MARDHARVYVRVNADREFAELDPVAQWLFHRLPSRFEMNWAGVLPLDPRRWAKMSRRATAEDIEKAISTLAAGRYLIVDEDTDEVLIRSLMRNDGIVKQPMVLRAALKAAEQVQSPLLRHELAVELRRVRPDAKEWQWKEIDAAVRTLDPDCSTNGYAHPSADPSVVGSADPSSNPPSDPSSNPPSDPSPNPPHGNPLANPSKEGSTRPHGEGVGVGVGESPSVGVQLGGAARAHAREAAPRTSASGGPPPPLPPEIENGGRAPDGRWLTQPCGRRHDPERDCRRCGELRRAERDAADQAVLAEAAERAEAARRRRDCPACDENGWLEQPDGGALTRCDHHDLAVDGPT